MAMKNSNAQFNIERFDGKGSFTLWQRRMKGILAQQGLSRVLKGKDGKPEDVKDNEWEDIELKCVSTIHLCLIDSVIFNVMEYP